MRRLVLLFALQASCSFLVARKNPDKCDPATPASCDADGILSLCVGGLEATIDCGSSERCLADEARCDTCNDGQPNPIGELCFEEPTTRLPAIENQPTKAILFQFDADTDADLAVLNENTNDISIFTNDSTTTEISFTPLLNINGKDQNPIRLPVGQGPKDLAVGDFNGDTSPDLVTVNFDDNDASIILGADGGFSDSFPIDIANPAQPGVLPKPKAITTADLNNDGRSDLLISDFGLGRLSIFLNNPVQPVTFQPTAFLNLGGQVNQLIAADLNNDGLPDVIGVDNTGGKVVIFLGTGGVNFNAPISITVGTNPTQCVLANIGGDSALDLVVVNEGSKDVSVIINQGNGSFSASTNAANAGTDPVSLSAVDFDGDADTDIVIANKNTNELSLLENQGGTLTPLPNTIPVGESPAFILSGAFNAGDNIDDLLFLEQGENDVASLKGTNDASLFAQLTRFTIGEFLFFVSLKDIDLDDDLDILTVNGGNTNIGVLLNQSDIEFQGLFPVGAGSFPYWVSPADVNNDGRLDLVTADGAGDTVSVFLANSNTIDFDAPLKLNPPPGSEPFAAITADFDGDGDPDIASANEFGEDLILFRNDTIPGQVGIDFALATTFDVGVEPQGIALANFNNDGRPDLVVSNSGSANVSLFINTGDLNFNALEKDASGNTLGVATGDLDGDGFDDVVTANNTNKLGLFFNQNGGGFDDEVAFDMQPGDNPRSVAVGDFDADGDLDIVTANQGTRSATILINDGRGAFSIGQNFAAGNFPRFVAAGDINADGVADIVVANNQTGDLTLILSQP